MLISSISEVILNFVTHGIKMLFLSIDSNIYSLISLLYQKFLVLASLRIFSDSMFQTITNAVYTLIGVLALFLLAYTLLKSMINPDLKKTGSDIKNIIIKTITSIIMILLVPTAFQFLYAFQNAILSHNVIGRVINPMSNNINFESNVNNTSHNLLNDCIDVDSQMQSDDDEDEVKLRCYGNMASVIMFQGFFHPNLDNENFKGLEKTDYTTALKTASDAIKSPNLPTDISNILSVAFNPVKTLDIFNNIWQLISGQEPLVITLTDAYNLAIVRGDFSAFYGFQDNMISGEITYTWGVSTLAGIFAAYVIFLYCLDVAVRAVKLAFYQIIAPIPILMRITKKDDIFKNWLKCVSSCYIEVFTRLIILYFGMFLISNVFAIMGSALSSNNVAFNVFSGGTSKFDFAGKFGLWLFVKANIILAVFAFMKKAPELIKQIFPSSDKFSLKLWDHLKDGLAIPATAVGFIGGTIAGGGNPLAGFRAASKGWKDSSLKGIGSEYSNFLKRKDATKSGMTGKALAIEKGRKILGFDSGVAAMDREIDSGKIVTRDKNGNKVETVLHGVNDTITTINLIDNEHNSIEIDGKSTINNGDQINATKENLEKLKTSRDTYKIELDAVSENNKKYSKAISGLKDIQSSSKSAGDTADNKLLKRDAKNEAFVYLWQSGDGSVHIAHGLDEPAFENNLQGLLRSGEISQAEYNTAMANKQRGNMNAITSVINNFQSSYATTNNKPMSIADSTKLDKTIEDINNELKDEVFYDSIFDVSNSDNNITEVKNELEGFFRNIQENKFVVTSETARDANGNITETKTEVVRKFNIDHKDANGNKTTETIEFDEGDSVDIIKTKVKQAIDNNKFTISEFVKSLGKNLSGEYIEQMQKEVSDGILTHMNTLQNQVDAHERVINTSEKEIELIKRGKHYTAKKATTDYANQNKGGN